MPQGKKTQFSCQGAELQCEELTEKASEFEARVSAGIHIETPKEVWLYRKANSKLGKAKAKTDRKSTSHISLACRRASHKVVSTTSSLYSWFSP